jgi:EAL domain-containing protein (putative c-di-GMP-specific phosphodiesterase class I)
MDAAALAVAMAADGLQVHYQPIVVMPAREVIGFEALARLRCPDGTLAQPADFIPAAEDSEQVGALGLAVLDQAVAEAARWRSGDGRSRAALARGEHRPARRRRVLRRAPRLHRRRCLGAPA